MPETETMVTYGASQVALWLGVTRSAVSNWLVRHWSDIPKPDAVIIGPGGDEIYGWQASREQEWRDWLERNHVLRKPRQYKRVTHYS